MHRAVTFVLLTASASAFAAAPFDADFTGATARIDYYHTGTATEERFALDRVRIEGPWPGSRTRLIAEDNLGPYRVEVEDLATQRVLFARGFASLYGEWESTDEARSGIHRTFAEAVRIPEPARPFVLRIRKRGADQAFREVWTTTVDPRSRFVDRAAVPQRTVLRVFEHGDPAVKVDLLILGDGYAASDMERFRADVRRLSDALFAVEPFRSRKGDFNVRAIETPSPSSGITRPRQGRFVESPLRARYNIFDSERYLMTLDDRAWRDIAAAAPYDAVLILADERMYGGGGVYGLYSTAAAGSEFAPYLVIHEFGHHFAALGDEYFTSDPEPERPSEALPEPWEPNLTALHDPAALKWMDLVTDGTPLPTPWNKAEFETYSQSIQTERRRLRAENRPEEEMEALFRREREHLTRTLAAETHAGKVGAFEGAGYRARGLYRPSADCLMFTRDEVGFCPVCRRAVERAIDAHSR